MSGDALFPPTPRERLAVVAAFVAQERGHRLHMQVKYEDDAGQLRYWQKRVAQCDEVKMHLDALASDVPAVGCMDTMREWIVTRIGLCGGPDRATGQVHELVNVLGKLDALAKAVTP